jgi:tRNA A-37 threonylcarbamoyl transferase component Bud32
MSESNASDVNEVVNRFQADLGALLPDQSHQLPDMRSQIVGTAKYTECDTGYTEGFLFDGEPERGLLIPRASYAFKPRAGHRLGREQSHNVVFFGQLAAASPYGVHEEIQVAVKSREHKNRGHLAAEAALFQHLGALGMKTFEVAGLLHGVEADHLLTYFDGPVTTMDTVDWSELTIDEAWLEVSKAVDTMVLLQAHGLFHGDLEFRNVAFNESNEIVIVDPELMVSATELYAQLEGAGVVLEEDEQRQALEKLAQTMGREFSCVSKSVQQMILPLYPKRERPRTAPQRLKVLKEHVYEPYKSRIRELDDPIRSILVRVFDQMMVKKKELAQHNIG